MNEERGKRKEDERGGREANRRSSLVLVQTPCMKRPCEVGREEVRGGKSRDGMPAHGCQRQSWPSRRWRSRGDERIRKSSNRGSDEGMDDEGETERKEEGKDPFTHHFFKRGKNVDPKINPI